MPRSTVISLSITSVRFQFFDEDVYHNDVGGDPRMVFFEGGKEVEEVDISKMDVQEINALLNSKGFFKSDKVVEAGDDEDF